MLTVAASLPRGGVWSEWLSGLRPASRGGLLCRGLFFKILNSARERTQ